MKIRMKISKILLFGKLVIADEEAFTTGLPPVTYIQPEEPDYFDLDMTSFFLQPGFEQYSQRPVNSLMRGRMGGLNPRSRNPHEKV